MYASYYRETKQQIILTCKLFQYETGKRATNIYELIIGLQLYTNYIIDIRNSPPIFRW